MKYDLPSEFYKSVLDSVSQQMAVIDEHGDITWVNEAWMRFSLENGGPNEQAWLHANYFVASRNAWALEDGDAELFFAGIQRVIHSEEVEFLFEYPCHSPTENRWFMMRFRMLTGHTKRRFIVTHQNITERKLAEIEMQELSIRDSLTGLANRRRFKEFLDAAWEQGRNSHESVSLAFIDLDYFKQYNDFYGHVAGDICLLQVAKILSKNTQKLGQLAARFGGDEFAIVFSNTSAESIEATISCIYSDLAALNLEHLHSLVSGNLTISIGVATLSAGRQNEHTVEDLLKAADAQLYEAKKLGRNKVAVKTLSRS